MAEVAGQWAPLTPYTTLRKQRMLIEWVFKTFWPKCDKCGEEIPFEPTCWTKPMLPFTDDAGKIEHSSCHGDEIALIQGDSLAVRILAYRLMLERMFKRFNVRCWYCVRVIQQDELSGAMALTLHHVDEDRSFDHLESVKTLGPEVGTNPHAELEVIHTTCHRRHHGIDCGVKNVRYYKFSVDRVNGARTSRPRNWRYGK